MIVAAHQPHYLPWLGYLDKVAEADVFVVMDDLQYEAQNFQNRNRIKLNHGAAWLTVPLERGAQGDRICDKRIDNRGSAQGALAAPPWHTLRIHYGARAVLEAYEPELRGRLTRRWDRLIDLDLHMLSAAPALVRHHTPVCAPRRSALRGQKTDRLESLCRAVGADVYLSGGGGSRGYLDVEQLARAGVRVTLADFTHPVYPQRYPSLGFVSHLACARPACSIAGPTPRACCASR